MIRRRVNDEFFLVTQHDHALLSGELAAHVGNKLFDRPDRRRESFLTAVAQHDCGWPLHDDQPTLNKDGLPLDVFESPRDVALSVWQAAVDRMLPGGDDYATLLVSLHVLSLSAFTMSTDMNGFDVNQARARFEINRFQHKQIEIQESLRKKLGLQTDVPLQQGLAIDSTDPGELELQYHFRLLQAMDMISLALCCTTPPVKQLRPIPIRPGGKTVALNLKQENATTLRVSPWVIDAEKLDVSVPFRRVPATAFADVSTFRDVLQSAGLEVLNLVILPG